VELAVVRQSAIDGQRAIQLLRRDDPRQLMRERERSQRQRGIRSCEDRGSQSLRAADDKRGALRRLLFPLEHACREVDRRQRTTTRIERDQAIARTGSDDAIGLALSDLERGAAIQRLILDLDDVEPRELGRTRLVLRCGLGQWTSCLADDDEPERD
jgi:hypothetical protein